VTLLCENVESDRAAIWGGEWKSSQTRVCQMGVKIRHEEEKILGFLMPTDYC